MKNTTTKTYFDFSLLGATGLLSKTHGVDALTADPVPQLGKNRHHLAI